MRELERVHGLITTPQFASRCGVDTRIVLRRVNRYGNFMGVEPYEYVGNGRYHWFVEDVQRVLKGTLNSYSNE